jgi:hypothetical protein
MTTMGCPDDIDERMELYCLHRLSDEQNTKFEQHLAICPVCLFETLETDSFIESLVLALKECDTLSTVHCRRMYT